MGLELREHTARKPDANGNPLKDENGKTIPLFPDERSLFYNDQLVGYVGSPPGHAIMFINHWAGADPAIVEEAKRLVAAEFGSEASRVNNVPQPDEPEVGEEYEDLGEDV